MIAHRAMHVYFEEVLLISLICGFIFRNLRKQTEKDPTFEQTRTVMALPHSKSSSLWFFTIRKKGHKNSMCREIGEFKCWSYHGFSLRVFLKAAVLVIFTIDFVERNPLHSLDFCASKSSVLNSCKTVFRLSEISPDNSSLGFWHASLAEASELYNVD